MNNNLKKKITNFDVEELEQRYEMKWSWHASDYGSPAGGFYF